MGTLGSQVYFLAKVSCLVHLYMVVVHTAEIISAAGFSQGQCHKDNVTSDIIYPPPHRTHTHMKSNSLSSCWHTDVIMMRAKMWWWSRRQSEIPVTIIGHKYHQSFNKTKTKVSTKSKCYSVFLSFILHILLSNIRSGSSFLVTVQASQVLMTAKKSTVYVNAISKNCLHSLDMTIFEWLEYFWHKMAFKMSQNIYPWVKKREKKKNR